jgi:hypothetical protein
MRQRHRFIPTAPDRLEDRVTLSQGMMRPVAAQVVRLEAGTRQAQTLDLRGTIFGNDTRTSAARAVPGVVLRSPTSFIYPLTKVTTIGRLSIRPGQTTAYDGTLTLTPLNRPGALRVRIFGTQAGPAGLPANLSYAILGGRGVFRGATGQGEVVFQDLPDNRGARTGFTLTFGDTTPTITA